MVRRVHVTERGQVLPFMACLLIALLGIVGLAIDAGRLYVARAELSRALDSAALAGVIELPSQPAAESRARAYLLENQPDAQVTFPAQVQNQLRVSATRRVDFLFMKVLGIKSMNVASTAAAGMGIVPSDTVMMVDATGSMGASPCNGNQDNSGCPIWEARQAALGFADLLMTSGLTKVGYSPFRGCHNPPRTFSGCVTESMRVDLTSNKLAVQTAIDNTRALGGTGTNVCLGLWKAREMFQGPNHQTAPNTLKSLVILSDGDNTYNNASYSLSSGTPPLECRPTTTPSSSDTYVGSNCSAPGQGSASGSNPGSNSLTRERQLDVATKAFADSMRAQSIEIYVVAFGVCGTLNTQKPTAAYCGQIGNTDADTIADQRLAKCIASSTPGTNDHYFAVPSASDLPSVFEDVAHAIAFRLIE